MVGRLVVERRLQASRGLLMALQRGVDEFGRVVIVLYDDVFWVGRIGDETLTWVHKHNGITAWDVSRWITESSPPGMARRFIDEINPDGLNSGRFPLGLIVAVL